MRHACDEPRQRARRLQPQEWDQIQSRRLEHAVVALATAVAGQAHSRSTWPRQNFRRGRLLSKPPERRLPERRPPERRQRLIDRHVMSVFAWGRGEDGQLGLGDTSDQLLPLPIETLSELSVKDMACGSGHTVVLTHDGEVHTWGRGDDGNGNDNGGR